MRRGFHGLIEADLEAFSPSRVAAHDGHGRLAEGKRAFYILNVHDIMTHATRLDLFPGPARRAGADGIAGMVCIILQYYCK